MKKIIKTLLIALVLFVSFGFIILQHPENKEKTNLEETTAIHQTETGSDLAVIQESNEDQW